jgi:putative phage-type endonuclease
MGITPEQREQRRGFLGASDIGALFGVDPFSTAYDLWCSKKYELDDITDNDAIELGKVMERALVEQVAKKKGLAIEFDVRYESGIFAANCDGVDVDGRVVVEAKTTSRPWEWGPEGTDQVPYRVTLQVQQQMMCGEAELAYVVVLLPVYGRLTIRIYEIPRSEPLIACIREAGELWWATHVVADLPPPEDPTLSVVQRIVREVASDADPVDLSTDTVAEYLSMRKAAGQAKKYADASKARLIAALGDQDHGLDEEGNAVTYRLQERKEYTVKAASYRVLRIKEGSNKDEDDEEK